MPELSFLPSTTGRHLIQAPLLLAFGPSVAMHAAVAGPPSPAPIPVRGTVALDQPVAVYNDWSVYDEL
jgi:hypothetical protein